MQIYEDESRFCGQGSAIFYLHIYKYTQLEWAVGVFANLMYKPLQSLASFQLLKIVILAFLHAVFSLLRCVLF